VCVSGMQKAQFADVR